MARRCILKYQFQCSKLTEEPSLPMFSTTIDYSVRDGDQYNFVHSNCGFIHYQEKCFVISNNYDTFAQKIIRMKKQLIISTSIDLVRIAPDKIVYIASDGNYSTLVQTDNEVRMLSYQLGQIEKMISSQLGSEGNIFIRIGKSLIINRSYIYYINIPKQKLTLSDVASFSHSVTASKEALKQLKELLEKEVK